MKKFFQSLLVLTIIFAFFLGGYHFFFKGKQHAKDNVKQTLIKNTITVPEGYSIELFETIEGTMEVDNLTDDEISRLNKVEQIAQQGLSIGTNSYHSNGDDKKVKISDLNNLSKEIRIDLSLFASELIQSVREQIGVTDKLYVNDLSLDFAKGVTSGYVADDWAFKSGHDVGAINDAAKKIGLKTYPKNGYENLAMEQHSGRIRIKTYTQNDEVVKEVYYYQQPLTKQTTLDELKKEVYNALLNLFFDDGLNPKEASNKNVQGHAKSLLGVAEFLNDGDSYFAVDTSFYSHSYVADKDYIYEKGVSEPSENTRIIHLIDFEEKDIIDLGERASDLEKYYQYQK